MSPRTLPLVLLLALACVARGQAVLALMPTWGGVPFVPGEAYRTSAGLEVRIDRCRFHLGVPDTSRGGSLTYHLVDLEAATGMDIPVPEGTRRLLLGVDSATSVAGAFGGDLDPTLGMYWTWNSGYINLKVEGRTDAAPKGTFQLHLGGYAGPHACARWIDAGQAAAGRTSLEVDLLRFMDAVDLRAHPQVMSPGPEAVRLSEAASGMFVHHAH